MLHKPELTDKLKSLSIDRTDAPLFTPVEDKRRHWPLVALALLTLSVLGGLSYAFVDLSLLSELADNLTQRTSSPNQEQQAVSSQQAQLASAPVDTVLPASQAPTRLPAGQRIIGSGYVVAERIVTVKPEVSGRITSIEVELGEQVRTGQVLARFDAVLLETDLNIAKSRVKKAQAEVAEAKAALEEARDPLRRMPTLREKGIISEATFNAALLKKDRLESSLLRAQQSLSIEELQVNKLEQQLDYYTVRAPFDGVVVARLSDVGKVLQSGLDGGPPNEGLVQLIDPDRLLIDVDIAEVNIAVLKPGLEGVAQLDAYPDKKVPVIVKSIVPFASRQKGTVSVRLSIPEPLPAMYPNMAAKVSFQLSQNN